MTTPLDLLGRPLHDVRISVTDRCNMRCRYCMPREVFGKDFAFMPQSELLSFEEIARLCRAFAACGARKVRLTGGEPLLRTDIERLVRMVSGTQGIEEVSMTTNGLLLERKAQALKDAGLSRVTVSLDAIEERTFQQMGDTKAPISRVLSGMEAARQAGLCPVKVNMVVRRGVNDGCILEMAERFRDSGQTLRFIEYMDVGESNGWELSEVVGAAEIREQIEARWPLRPVKPSREGEVATRWVYEDGSGEVGFIHSVSEPFCGSCDRLRLSAEGKLYTCLFARQGSDMKPLLRSGASDKELVERVRRIWQRRSDRYSAERSAKAGNRLEGLRPRIEMSYIGG